jgi:hypothetical protein
MTEQVEYRLRLVPDGVADHLQELLGVEHLSGQGLTAGALEVHRSPTGDRHPDEPRAGVPAGVHHQQAAAGGGHSPPMDALAAELAASAALSIAFASRGRPDAPGSSGAGAAGAALLAMVTISSLARNWPTLPSIAVVSHHERWWWVAAAALAAVAWSWRDPAARSCRAVRSWYSRNGARTAEADRSTVP